jgi:hypothetical protein
VHSLPPRRFRPDRGAGRPLAHRPKLGAIAQKPQPITLSSDARAGPLGDDGLMSKPKPELNQTAASGEDEATPWILLGEVWIVAATAFLTILAVSLLAYRLAT